MNSRKWSIIYTNVSFNSSYKFYFTISHKDLVLAHLIFIFLKVLKDVNFLIIKSFLTWIRVIFFIKIPTTCSKVLKINFNKNPKIELILEKI